MSANGSLPGATADGNKFLLWVQALAGALVPVAFEFFIRSSLDPLLFLRPVDVLVVVSVAIVAAMAAVLVARRRSAAAAFGVAFGLVCWPVVSLAIGEILFDLIEPFGTVRRAVLGLLALFIGTAVAGVVTFLTVRVSRSSFARWTLVFSVGAALLAGALLPRIFSAPPRSTPGGPPDVILVVLDTVRADHLSVYGYARPTTPALERFSEKARVYERAWSPAPWTPPAHASIFTGLLPAEHGCEGGPLETLEPTLAEVLSENGYATLGVVNNPMLAGSKGWSRGFDDYREIWTRPGFSAAYPYWLATVRNEDWKFTGDTGTALDWVRRWWRRNGASPRFVTINLLDPHSPYGPRGKKSEVFLTETTRRAPTLSNDSEDYDAGLVRAEGVGLERIIALYDADVLYMDEHLGEFFDWLLERGELDQTAILVTADHGERLGERGLLGHQLGLDETLLRVPLIIRYPPAVERGRVRGPVQTHGLFSTVLELAGVPAPDSSMQRAPAVEAQENPVIVAQMRHQAWYIEMVTRRRPAFDGSPFAGHWGAATDGTWKLVRSTTGATRLYFLPEDPAEGHDLSLENQDVVARLSPWLDALPVFDVGPDSLEVPEDTRELLKSLGYVD